MSCVGYICGIQYRIELSLDNDQVSHGVCNDCLPAEIERMGKELTPFKRMVEKNCLKSIHSG